MRSSSDGELICRRCGLPFMQAQAKSRQRLYCTKRCARAAYAARRRAEFGDPRRPHMPPYPDVSVDVDAELATAVYALIRLGEEFARLAPARGTLAARCGRTADALTRVAVKEWPGVTYAGP